MTQTAFEPRTHGFAFANSWMLDEEERQQLYEAFARCLKWGVILGAACFGLTGAVFVPLAIRALRGKLVRDMARGYGLCGGMSFAALDFYGAGLPLPRGQHADDRPAGGMVLRNYIWSRQIDSLLSDAPRFLAWLIILNYVPATWPFNGGPAWLLAQSKREWQRVKAALDAGEPMPIGLVRDTKNVFDNHQVLAIGYKETEGDQVTLYVCDPNCPGQVSVISFKFGERMLHGQQSCGTAPPLRGFFCQTYAPRDPSAAIG
jgi:hypothetical protein